MASQPGKQAMAIHIFPNISRGQGNLTMIFGHLLEYNMRKIFLVVEGFLNILKLSSGQPAFTSYKAF